jgi:methylphosphotriester-DNA--protein-cysteine methyltransferase
LSDDIGMSQKHLIAQFKQMVGVPPKGLARLCRFKNVIYSLDPMQPVDWTRVAHQACYYDQPHFNKDFEAFTGHSPTDYLRLRRQYYAAYPERARSPQQLPTG